MDRLNTASSRFALVAEGNSIIRLDAVTILEDAGFRVLDVATSEQAIELLRQHSRGFTLLFTAVSFAGGQDGFALARMVASNYPHISVVVASGHDKPASDDLPESACFIPKPFTAKIVRQHIQQIMPDDRKPSLLG